MVFSPPVLPEEATRVRERWIAEARAQGGGLGESGRWKGELVELAVKCAGNSAPGPDGIPYGAYKHSALVVDILKDVAAELVEGEGEGEVPRDFDYSRLIYLPKKPPGRIAEGVEYHLPE
eukprot:3282926-Lingulodinium_polyedra.AAC.1